MLKIHYKLRRKLFENQKPWCFDGSTPYAAKNSADRFGHCLSVEQRHGSNQRAMRVVRDRRDCGEQISKRERRKGVTRDTTTRTGPELLHKGRDRV